MSDRQFCCDQMKRQVAANLIKYDNRFDEYSIVVQSDDEVEVLQSITYCPWSGDILPISLRERWFDELERIGVDPLNDEIPFEFTSDTWRQPK